MGEAVLLIDSDAFLLLGGAGLLGRALDLLGFDKSRALRLSPLELMIGRSQSIKRRYSADARQAARLLCAEIVGIADRPDDDLLQQLLMVPDIDDGEALLYASLATRPAYLLASGDKRAMIALNERSDVAEVRGAVTGRVICLESILRLLVDRDGASEVGSRLLAASSSHKTLQVVFSVTNMADNSQCLAALDSYIANLKHRVGDDFLYEPPHSARR